MYLYRGRIHKDSSNEVKARPQWEFKIAKLGLMEEDSEDSLDCGELDEV